eukprot:6366610-Alexandrium_andersonii.AAC.1
MVHLLSKIGWGPLSPKVWKAKDGETFYVQEHAPERIARRVEKDMQAELWQVAALEVARGTEGAEQG